MSEENLVQTLDMIFGEENVFVVNDDTDFSENSDLTKRMKKLLNQTKGDKNEVQSLSQGKV